MHILELSPTAFRLYVLALLWAVNRATDGIITARLFDDCRDIGPDGIHELEDSGLWVRRDDGWLIPDFAISQVTSRRAASRGQRKERADERQATVELLAVLGEQENDAETYVYRWYDVDDQLLYVGITNDLEIRRAYHRALSSWADFAARETVECYPRREVARGVEAAAIVTERPLFNHVHQATPEARERLVRYLVSKERFDLLAPAVSRGYKKRAA